jgi:DNA-binding XRE family transcriptional regulator
VPDRELLDKNLTKKRNSYRSGTFGLNFDFPSPMFPFRHFEKVQLMDANDSAIDGRASEAALIFGALIRSRRKALKMRQDQLALATGVGRRFLIELEGGKPSCQLGRSLLVAEALGIRAVSLQAAASPGANSPELPDLTEEAEEPNG